MLRISGGWERPVNGFTLIELTLVVALLGILATIVFAAMGNDVLMTREVATKSDLRMLRTQVVAYQVQHNSALPPDDHLVGALTSPTDIDGNVVSGSGSHFGPYLTYIPPNPQNGLATIKVIPVDASITPDDSSGWIYQGGGPTGFAVIANTTKLDSAGKPISGY